MRMVLLVFFHVWFLFDEVKEKLGKVAIFISVLFVAAIYYGRTCLYHFKQKLFLQDKDDFFL